MMNMYSPQDTYFLDDLLKLAAPVAGVFEHQNNGYENVTVCAMPVSNHQNSIKRNGKKKEVPNEDQMQISYSKNHKKDKQEKKDKNSIENGESHGKQNFENKGKRDKKNENQRKKNKGIFEDYVPEQTNTKKNGTPTDNKKSDKPRNRNKRKKNDKFAEYIPGK